MYDSNCCSESVSYAAVEGDCTDGLVIKVFDDSDKVGAGVVLLRGCPDSCMPNPVEVQIVDETGCMLTWCLLYKVHIMHGTGCTLTWCLPYNLHIMHETACILTWCLPYKVHIKHEPGCTLTWCLPYKLHIVHETGCMLT